MKIFISLTAIIWLIAVNSLANAQATNEEGAKQPVREFQASTSGWRVVCQATNANAPLVCEASQSISEGNGKPFLTITLIHANKGAFGLKLQLPHGLDLTTAVTMQVDTGAKLSLPFNTSLPTGSFITTRLSKNFVQTMRQGSTLKVNFKSVNKSDINVPVSLAGLTRALNKVSTN